MIDQAMKSGYPDISSIAEKLIGDESANGRRNIQYHNTDIPNIGDLQELMELFRAVFFPGFFSQSGLNKHSLRFQIASNLDRAFAKLSEQIRLGFCFTCKDTPGAFASCENLALDRANRFMETIPQIRDLLDSDALAAYEGDPAARSVEETIFCYPSVRIMTNHRVAHELYKLDVPIIPRIISEMAHSQTGIDIHPGATIDEEFFIDHGTGVVIGETAVIGKRCRIYQGVTLGALSFPKDEEGNPIKGIPRHPVLEDCVTVYSGATILGRITIGKNSTIGGNVWITGDVPPNSKVLQRN